jgi:arsenate reductase
MKNILFVCSGNSCRSQMAEGLGKKLADGRFNVKSAGVTPIGVHPMAIRTMAEIGIDISDQTSKMLDSKLIKWADYIVTLCNTARDNCPVIPSNKKQLHWDIKNPDRIYSSEKVREAEFAKSRNEIKGHIEKLFDELK